MIGFEKTLGTNTCAWDTWWNFHYLIFWMWCYFNLNVQDLTVNLWFRKWNRYWDSTVWLLWCHSSIGRTHAWSHTVGVAAVQWITVSSPTNVDEDSAAILAAKRSSGVREWVLYMPLPSSNNAAHSGFETRGDVARSPKQGYQWPHQ